MISLFWFAMNLILTPQFCIFAQAIEQGNQEGARIYAQNAIRQKNLSINYLRLSSRVDAVASRVETAVRMGRVTNSMANIVKAMDQSMKAMNLEKAR